MGKPLNFEREMKPIDTKSTTMSKISQDEWQSYYKDAFRHVWELDIDVDGDYYDDHTDVDKCILGVAITAD